MSKEKNPIIKSPLRNLKHSLDKEVAQSYQPEYVRRGVEPIPRNEGAVTDFRNDFRNRKRPFVTSSAGKRPATEFEKQTRVGRAEVEVPHQVHIQSGGNHEHTWYPAEEAEQYDNGDIRYDEIPDPPRQPVYPYQKDSNKVVTNTIRYENVNYDDVPAQSPENKSLSLKDLPPGGYALVETDKVLYISDSLAEIEEVIEFVLFDPTSPYEEARAEDFKVIKSLPLRVGVLVKE